MKFTIKNKRVGFSLIETLVAVTVLVFGIVGPLTLAQMSLRSFPQIRDRITAEYLAAEGLETIKNIRDTALIQDPAGGIPNTGGGPFDFNPCQSANGCYVDASEAAPRILACAGNCPKIKYDSISGSYNYATGGNTVFTRKIFITFGNLNVSGANGEEATVRVRVEWSSRFVGTESVEFSNYITDWFRF